MITLLEPNLEKCGQVLENTEAGDQNRMEKSGIHRQFQLVIQHQNSQSVSDEHEDLVVQLEPLVDELSHQLGCFNRSGANDMRVILFQLLLTLQYLLVSVPVEDNGANKLRPILNQVKDVLPLFPLLLVDHLN